MMLGPDSEDERFVLELVRNWYAELNPRVRCAFGNVSIQRGHLWVQDIEGEDKESVGFRAHSIAK